MVITGVHGCTSHMGAAWSRARIGPLQDPSAHRTPAGTSPWRHVAADSRHAAPTGTPCDPFVAAVTAADTDARVGVRGGTLAYTDVGRGEPLLLVHGTIRSARTLPPCAIYSSSSAAAASAGNSRRCCAPRPCPVPGPSSVPWPVAGGPHPSDPAVGRRGAGSQTVSATRQLGLLGTLPVLIGCYPPFTGS
ncbi:hypothetical protein Vau01_045640 [Virgisporangium aurantiacum]|uniref:Uncharacterized protein n=1 Tax=Virgisporangium aurantiacum TaxID=175570 RepID=A0A8J3Z644_9ACTN|nr:hypothetical protein Vau01_045640 [Virgisporangium aurantiacum]